ncbi:efflux RND transporter permease subunit [Fimbriimonas ginsengisoli]|uniref:Putative cobalt-zinc-cadmium resistance protein CzcA n=1 Tax=Fimbriimonas ginsengisoli Gsoil 348 TaxID=661478 RepID=A0A068NLB8_FIMGI|nr:CusA/CzcA family heavy metal efflux RND transporter [Fimbriimonas ginsengisoli]AIE84212.1 putative cobalt-zinc-cadmium resistance protein CzcA [Fimbriimonas ginsengisoli Gsoil 348]
MIERFLEGVVKQRFLSLACGVLLVVVGILAMRSLNIDAFPDITPVRVEVDTSAPGLASEEVEKLVTHPLEVGLQGIPKATKIKSESKFGVSVVTVYFEDDADIYWARDQVFQSLGDVSMPAGITPSMGPNDTGTGQIYIYAVKSPSRSNMELRTLQDWTVTPALKAVPGVADCLSFGGEVKQYQVMVDPDRLKAHGLSLDDVIGAIGKNNQNTGGNYVQHGGQQYIVRGIGMLESADDIGNIVVAAKNGTPTFVKNLGTVQIGPEERQGSVSEDAKGEVVSGIVVLRLGSNTSDVIQRVKERLASLKKDLPADVTVVPLYDQSILIKHSIDTVRDALIAGEILVILILFLMLSNLRAATIAALAVPICMLAAFILMWRAGISANLLSLGGLAISIGMMIDASIVVTENIYRNVSETWKEGETLDSVVLRGVVQTGRPVLFAILIVIAAFIPLLALRGIEGRLFVPLALSIIFSMVGSVIMAFVVTPALCLVLLKGGHPEPANKLVQWMRSHYERSLDKSIRKPRRITVIWLLLTVFSVFLFSITGSEFLPSLDENNFRVRATLPTSISLDEATKLAGKMQAVILKNPNVEHAICYVGRASLGGDPEQVSNCEISIPLKPPADWVGAHSKSELEQQLRSALNQFAGVQLEFSQELEMRNDELISGFNTPIAIFVKGDDTNVLLAKANEIANQLRKVNGATDVAVEDVAGIDDLDIVPNRAAIARYGINVADVMNVVQSAVAGTAASTFYEGEKHFDIQVRMMPQYRNNAQAIGNLLVPASSGLKIPLSELATIQVHQGLSEIGRMDAKRHVAVKADVQGRSVGAIVADAKALIAKNVVMPPGYSVEFGGAVEELQHALETLYWAVPGSLLLIFVLVYACFGSMRDSLVVLTAIPLAIIGGTVLLIALGLPISVPAIIGYIANFGTEVQNSTIMVSSINRWRRAGYSAAESASFGATERLRPEILSALIGVLALIPFLMTSGIGATVERPLAAVVIGGIAFSRPLTWFLVPTFYVWLHRDRKGTGSNRSRHLDPVDLHVVE